MSTPDGFESFLELSIALTGFNRVELLGTGVAHTLFGTVVESVGETVANELWIASDRVLKSGGATRAETEAALRENIFATAKLGPVARNVIVLWYLGIWNQLPDSWSNTYGSRPQDVTRIVSGEAYIESLVWPAIGAHPSGAKQPGFGTWSTPPKKRLDGS